MKRIGLLCVVIAFASLALDKPTKPHTFTAGTSARASQVNTNFDTLYSKVGQVIDTLSRPDWDFNEVTADTITTTKFYYGNMVCASVSDTDLGSNISLAPRVAVIRISCDISSSITLTGGVSGQVVDIIAANAFGLSGTYLSIALEENQTARAVKVGSAWYLSKEN
jgi:hypothetical protein